MSDEDGWIGSAMLAHDLVLTHIDTSGYICIWVCLAWIGHLMRFFSLLLFGKSHRKRKICLERVGR